MLSKEAWMAKGALAAALLAFAATTSLFTLRYDLDISWSLYFLGAITTAVSASVTYLKIAIQVSPKIKNYVQPPKVLENFHALILAAVDEDDEKNEAKHKNKSEAPFFSRNVDKEINAILQRLIDDNILSWLTPLMIPSSDTMSVKEIEYLVKRDVWVALQRIGERLSQVDKVQVIACDVIQKVSDHFEKIRLATQQATSLATKDDEIVNIDIPMHGFLNCENKECEFLAKVADILMLFLLPHSYSTCIGTRSTLRELLARRVLHRAIDYISDPININKNIVKWVVQGFREEDETLTNPHLGSIRKLIKSDTFARAESFEDFLASLTKSNDLSALKQQRLYILTEIVQATTFTNSAKDGKSSEYFAQLVKAKTVLENRLQELGCDPYGGSVTENPSSSVENLSMTSSMHSLDTIDGFIAGRKSLSFKAIMNTPFSRRYFYSFLEQQSKQDLLGFWAAVEELKESDRTLWHQLATEIFYTFLHKPSRAIKLSKSCLKQIEAFLMGDTGPDIFYEIQADVMTTLETSYYPAFLISDLCYQMLEEAHENNVDIVETESNREEELVKSPKKKNIASEASQEASSQISNFLAKSHLDHVTEKLQNKSQALKALKSSLKPDSKVLKILQSQVDSLRDSQYEIEQHLERTDAWTEHLGKWRCHVQTVEYLEEEDALKAVLIVHVPVKRDNFKQQRPPSWVCSRNVQEFHSLHRELMPYFAWLKDMALPSASGGSNGPGGNSLINFGGRSLSSSSSQNRMEKARSVLQKYMDAVLCDERLNQSETVYSFLSPSPNYLKPKVGEKGKKRTSEDDQKFQLSNFFKGGNDADRHDPNRKIQWLDKHSIKAYDDHVLLDSDAHDLGGGDGVAEPLYALIGEVFEMKGLFKLLRKSLMTFVQITYGSTINRQLKDTVAWITSEHMVIRYLKAIKTSLWPEGVTANQDDLEENDEAVKRKARELLLKQIPDWLTQLVGQQASKMGTAKVFDSLQEKTLNKMLAYDLLEILIYNLFPELVRSYAFQQFRTMSV